jgi:hypothetical protein
MVVVAKCAECLPLHRQAKMFPLHGIDIPDQTNVRLDGAMWGAVGTVVRNV